MKKLPMAGVWVVLICVSTLLFYMVSYKMTLNQQAKTEKSELLDPSSLILEKMPSEYTLYGYVRSKSIIQHEYLGDRKHTLIFFECDNYRLLKICFDDRDLPLWVDLHAKIVYTLSDVEEDRTSYCTQGYRLYKIISIERIPDR